MIQKINHQNASIAKGIYHVFQDSYAVEAKILKAVDFPPLKRSIDNFINSQTLFFGFNKDHNLSAVIELDIKKTVIHIQSLVVDPNYFRQGIAGKLINHVFDNFKAKLYTVETGADNVPAIKLYEKFGFVEKNQYDTDHGIRKIRLERSL